MRFKQNHKRHLRHFVSMPFIYMMIIPLVILDLLMEVYHRICFPLYGLDYVERDKYIAVDRHRLSYLTAIEKINCAYCGYANGLMSYATAIAANTESYWCGIKHARKVAQPHQENFLPYGDEKSYEKLRD